MAYTSNFKQRLNECCSTILKFIDSNDGFLRLGMILVTPNSEVFGIISKHGNYSNNDMKFAAEVLNALSINGIKTIRVDEQAQLNLKYRKFSALNRQNSTGWDQSRTKLVAYGVEDGSAENARNKYLEWKNKTS